MLAGVAAASRIGEVLASKYRLEALLGSGAMGDVYRAVNEGVGRAVAIKMLRPEHVANPLVVERFMREARTANLVRHPNVVDVLDIDKDDRGTPFLVQELLDGEDLASFVDARGGKLREGDLVALLTPVIDALAEAHARGVVHRDIKPANVFLAKTARGTVPKLLDFGISKVTAPDVRATEVGTFLGTPAYMAPEQVQGARDADPRTDVWALGTMMFELLAGRLPFDAMDAPALFVAIATRDAPTLRAVNAAVSPELSRIVERCLRRRPDERYASAAELARDLAHASKGEPLEPTGRKSLPPEAGEHAVPVTPAREEPPSEICAPRPPSLPPPPPPRRPPPRASRLAPEAALPGVMLAASPSHAPVSRPPRPRPAQSPAAAKPASDVAALIGVAVVGAVVVFVVGVLMQVFHRAEGWPIAKFVVAAPPPVAIAIHVGLALVALAIGVTYCRRALRHWRGELGGGPPNAVVAGAMAAATFFAAIELVSALP